MGSLIKQLEMDKSKNQNRGGMENYELIR